MVRPSACFKGKERAPERTPGLFSFAYSNDDLDPTLISLAGRPVEGDVG
jgi:hypothetical protein